MSTASRPSPVIEEDPDPASTYAVRLALTFSNWVDRRVERFEFVDGRTVRRQMSVDFTLPPEEAIKEGATVPVPVMILRKGVMRGLDVTDADGRSLNVVESDKGHEFAVAGLERVLRGIVGAEGTVPSAAIEAVLKAEDDEELRRTKDSLRKDGEIGRVLAGAGSRAAREAVGALIEELSEGFMLLVSMPYKPEMQGLIKVRYDLRIDTSLRQSGQRRSRTERVYFLFSRLFSSLGMVGRTEYFTALPLRFGKSYHAEVIPAPGTYSEEAKLSIENVPAIEGAPTLRARGSVGNGRKCSPRDAVHSRPHVWIKGGGNKTNRDESGRLEVILHAEREGLIFPLFFSAGVIAGVLAYVKAQDGYLDGITLGALLLAPVALAAYYARSDENGYLTTAMRGVRYLATAAILAGVAVIGLLALGFVQPHEADPQALEKADAVTSNPAALTIVHWAAGISLVCAVALFLALIAPFFNELARRKLIGIGIAPKARDMDIEIGARDLTLLLLPPVFLIAAGAGATFALFALLPI